MSEIGSLFGAEVLVDNGAEPLETRSDEPSVADDGTEIRSETDVVDFLTGDVEKCLAILLEAEV